MRTTPRVILILKQASLATRRCEILAKKIAVTWWQELHNRTCNGQKDRRHMVTAVQRESLCGRDMVRGVQRESLCQRDLVTGAQEEVTYCSPSITSGKQKKNRSTSQPQIRSENTPATIEADQIFLALQQLANKNNSANFDNNINRISKLPKSLTTTMPTFDGKSEKLSCLKIYSRRASKYIMSPLKMT